MRRTFIISGVVAATPFVWIVAASAIFCNGIGRRDLIAFPFLQWAEYGIQYWHANWWIKLWVVVGAGVPTLFLLAGLIGLIGYLSGTVAQPNLYGATGWASPADMRDGGIKIEKDAF